MLTEFTLQLILSFIAGFILIPLATFVAEKKGTKLGGVIAGLPSTVVIGLFFIGWVEGTKIAVDATSIIPIMMGVYALFVTLYLALYTRGFVKALTISLLAWSLGAFILVIPDFDSLVYSLLGFVAFFLISLYIIESQLKISAKKSKKLQYSSAQLVLRGLFGGSIIAISVIAAKLGGPILGGIFASFPAVALSTMIIAHREYGMDFSKALMKSIVISSALNVTIYSLIVKFIYPVLGLIQGTLFAFTISLAVAYLIYELLLQRLA